MSDDSNVETVSLDWIAFSTVDNNRFILVRITDIKRFEEFSQKLTKLYLRDGAEYMIIGHISSFIEAMFDKGIKNEEEVVN